MQETTDRVKEKLARAFTLGRSEESHSLGSLHHLRFKSFVVITLELPTTTIRIRVNVIAEQAIAGVDTLLSRSIPPEPIAIARDARKVERIPREDHLVGLNIGEPSKHGPMKLGIVIRGLLIAEHGDELRSVYTLSRLGPIPLGDFNRRADRLLPISKLSLQLPKLDDLRRTFRAPSVSECLPFVDRYTFDVPIARIETALAE
jgi:hypothetical protein